MISSSQKSVEALRDELRERIESLSEQRLRSASDFNGWLQPLEDEAEAAAFSRNSKLQAELEEQLKLAQSGQAVDWRKVRGDVQG